MPKKTIQYFCPKCGEVKRKDITLAYFNTTTKEKKHRCNECGNIILINPTIEDKKKAIEIMLKINAKQLLLSTKDYPNFYCPKCDENYLASDVIVHPESGRIHIAYPEYGECKKCKGHCYGNRGEITPQQKEEWQDEVLGKRFPDGKICRSPKCGSRRYKEIMGDHNRGVYGGQPAPFVHHLECANCGITINHLNLWPIPDEK